MDLSKLKYSPTHEWAQLEGDTCTVGITSFAAEQLQDITYLKLPKVGDAVKQEGPFGEVETVKAVSDIYAPVAGTISAVNEKLVDDPETIKNDPFGAGWLVKIRMQPGTSTAHLLSYEQYQKQIESSGH
ncbi:MAG TPA: glycine cleavage system protein GcvH [Gemmataceae bacterium]|nr:glycine cleavage system protein GcvH [Gemmataceae bacterium]